MPALLVVVERVAILDGCVCGELFWDQKSHI